MPLGLIFVSLTVPAVPTAHTTADLVATVVVSVTTVAILVRAFLAGTVRARNGRVVIRSLMWTSRYAAADIVRFEAVPGMVGPRKRLLLAAVTTSGRRPEFDEFNCPLSGRGSDLVPTTASRLNAYLAAYR